jgi:hypothetical protein
MLEVSLTQNMWQQYCERVHFPGLLTLIVALIGTNGSQTTDSASPSLKRPQARAKSPHGFLFPTYILFQIFFPNLTHCFSLLSIPLLFTMHCAFFSAFSVFLFWVYERILHQSTLFPLSETVYPSYMNQHYPALDLHLGLKKSHFSSATPFRFKNRTYLFLIAHRV